MTTREALLQLAAKCSEESDLIDFKREFSPEKKAQFWAETVKDIVAFANSNGGVIVFGLLDDGSPSGIDCSKAAVTDPAAITDQIKKYTGSDFSDVSLDAVERAGAAYPCILVGKVDVPLVFTKVGTYEVEPGTQKTAFSKGTVYFRHGSKSEPCTREDLEAFLSRRLEAIRGEWLGNIRKVVEAEPGSSVIVAKGGRNEVRISNDPTAPAVQLERLDRSHPHRQSEVIKLVNDRLDGNSTINSHDIQAIKAFEGIDEQTHPEYMHKPHDFASPQYSNRFIDMIIESYSKDSEYFVRCREKWKALNYSCPS